jgi:hypothetical protein
MSELDKAKQELQDYYDKYYDKKAIEIGKIISKKNRNRNWQFFFNSVVGGGIFLTIGGFIDRNPWEWGVGLGIIAIGLLIAYMIQYGPQTEIYSYKDALGWSLNWLLRDEDWEEIPEERRIEVIRNVMEEHKVKIEKIISKTLETI